ncbi:Mannan polymerase II complex ANP1 subunit [Candida maltosa Xu316]|uniref:Mannan polymerase II complex ANP1 subunit n=1 Tax=Candida maltosa (strain Xu316) TaxID=1245528 RepID=M3JW32_CANMX|nr:Mannan polymerase II complex ANP1 subunit [Candida maltosa Xu316]
MSTYPVQHVTPYDYHDDDDDEKKLRSNNTFKIFYSLRTILVVIIVGLITLFTIISQLVRSNSGYAPNLTTFGDQVQFFDLANYQGSANGWQYNERVLFCVPLRDAAAHLPMFFGHMKNLTYPHDLIDLAFLVSDSSDDTMGELKKHLNEIQKDPSLAFGQIEIFEKDFGQAIGQGFSDRHGFAAQGPRRKLMARARNWLWTVAIKPHHSFVYWRDADVETVPPTILEDLMHHDKDVIVPNVWRPLPDWLGNQQPYDLNSWQESEGGLQLADTLNEDDCIVEGYVEYQTWRPHLAYLRDPYGDPEVEMELDGIGGVSILTKAKVFRTGSHFPAFSFEKHAETEAFGKLSKRMGYSVVGLPHYVIWHIYEPSSDDLKHMEWMALEEVRQQEEAKIKKVYDKVWDKAFEDVQDDWNRERNKFLKNTDMSKVRKIKVDWPGVDEIDIDKSLKDGKKLADFNP